ncbi:MAG: hypothetical protein ACI4QV_06635 [Acutalibacteraceae bacterium]
MNNTSLMSSKDIYIEINGVKAAVVESYRVSASRNNKKIGCFGEKQPVATVCGKTEYTVELSKVCATGSALNDGIDLYSLSNFNVVIVKPGKKIIFSGCEWDSITETANLTDSVIEKISLTALKRVCVD